MYAHIDGNTLATADCIIVLYSIYFSLSILTQIVIIYVHNLYKY